MNLEFVYFYYFPNCGVKAQFLAQKSFNFAIRIPMEKTKKLKRHWSNYFPDIWIWQGTMFMAFFFFKIRIAFEPKKEFKSNEKF